MVGPTGGGKTTCQKILADTLTALSQKVEEEYSQGFYAIKQKIMNPKAISMGELYGQENPDSQEWVDGLASKIIRKYSAAVNDPRHFWVTFDGPVDALWIENMNTVLDDNMTLCLASGERVKLRDELRMMFEA